MERGAGHYTDDERAAERVATQKGSHERRHRLQQAVPTAEDISQSNATLQIMTGRNMAWAHNNTGGDGSGSHGHPPLYMVMGSGGGSVHTPGSTLAIPTPTPAPSSAAVMVPPTATTRASASRPPADFSHPSLQHEQMSSRLPVQWSTQSPQTAAPPPTATMPPWNVPDWYRNPDALPVMNAARRMSTDVRSHTLPQSGLPSPASSEGISQSPITHVRRRPVAASGAANPSFGLIPTVSTTPARHPSGMSPAAVPHHPAAFSPPLPPSTSAAPTTSQDLQSRSMTAPRLPNHRPASHGSVTPIQPPSPAQHSPAQTYLRDMPSLPNPAPQHHHTSARMNLPPKSKLPPKKTPRLSAITPFRGHVDSFMEMILQQQTQFPGANATNSLESGRLLLLSEALTTGDGVGLVLHQLFCLASVPRALPQAFGQIDPNSFRPMETLLGFNRDADPRFVAFCATFPEPLEKVYAGYQPQKDAMSDIFVRAVGEFLAKFPRNWDYLRSLSARMSAPPLVQDLVDVLGIHSAVLQTAAFRSVARGLKGIDDLRSVAYLEEVHRHDKIYYYRYHFRRSAGEMADLYNHFSGLVAELRQWQLGPKEAPFQLPKEVMLSALRQQPQSMVRTHLPGQPPLSDPSLSQLSHAQQQQTSPGSNSPAAIFPQGPFHAPMANHANSTASPMHRPRPSNLSRLFPSLQETPRPQPTHPEPLRSALHQAHLRSPILMAKQTEAGAKRLYRYVIGFSLPPTKLDMSCQSQAVSFLIPDLAMELKPKNVTPSPKKGGPPELSIDEGSRAFRLRCCIMPPTGFPTEADWVVADNFWPEEMYLDFNGHILEKRRKLQHGKYLPVELTEFAKGQKDGPNILKVFLNRKRDTPPKHEYIIAVELIGFTSQESIVESLRRLSAEESINTVKKSLAGDPNGADDDDEIAVTSSSLTIQLFDPYSASKIFDVPVRGASCLHRDCFDLDTFLAMCKRPSGQNQPTVVDCWRCPLCRGDVRPQTLLIDEFLVEVRQELALRNQLDTRAIVVQADGSWKPKPEERTGTRSRSLEHQQNTRASAPASKQQTNTIEIIHLD